MTGLGQDVRYSLRSLRRSPGFAAAVILMLALGVGANTAIFSVIHAVFLRPLPYPRAEELRAVSPVLDPANGPPDTLGYWSYPMYEAFRENTTGFERLAAYTPNAAAYNLTGGESAERVRVEMASADYFPLLGVRAERGRTFLPEEDGAGTAAPVALLSHGLWQRSYAGDPGIVGRDISLNSIPFTVVGILPRGFRGLSGEAEVWVPIAMAPALTFARRLEGATSFWHFVVGRTSAGPPSSALDARLSAAARSVEDRIPLAEAFGDVDLAFAAVPLRDILVDAEAGAPLPVLMGAMAFLLLIVCVNVANLLLTRLARRRRELGVRVALGASRARIARQLAAEGAVLAALGGAGGAIIAAWGVKLLQSIAPEAGAGPVAILAASVDGTVLLFNFAVAALAALAVAVLPAARALRRDPGGGLRGTAGVAADSSRIRSGLVCAELALALVLLAGAGLMLRSLAGLHAAPLGFDPSGLLTANVELPRQAYSEEEVVRFLDDAVRRLEAVPGVIRADAAYCLPLAGRCDNVGMDIRGEVRPPDAPRHPVWLNMVAGGHFRTFGIPLVGGRTFTAADRADAPRVAIVNEAAARAYWPGRSPIGERIQLSVGWEDWAEVVGVAADVKRESVTGPASPGVYVALPQWFYRSNYLVAKTDGDPLAWVGALVEVVRDLDPAIPLWDVQTMEERIGATTARTRFSATLLSLAAGMALLLSAAGVFGVLAFVVTSRTREFGLRMAIGARERDVLRLVLRRALLLVAAGLGVGLAAAFALTRVLSSQLYGVEPTDPPTLACAAVLLLLVALAAAWLPARRATKADPMIALRAE